jgi:hypothetical protein
MEVCVPKYLTSLRLQEAILRGWHNPPEHPNSTSGDEKYIQYSIHDNKFVKMMNILCLNKDVSPMMFIADSGNEMRICNGR